MSSSIPLTDDQIAKSVDEWVNRGNTVKQLKLKESGCKWQPYAKFQPTDDGALNLIHVEPRRRRT